jgi:hypothetical protein
MKRRSTITSILSLILMISLVGGPRLADVLAAPGPAAEDVPAKACCEREAPRPAEDAPPAQPSRSPCAGCGAICCQIVALPPLEIRSWRLQLLLTLDSALAPATSSLQADPLLHPPRI